MGLATFPELPSHDEHCAGIGAYLRAHALSLVECRPLTGRTHQIRAHMAHRGWPLVSDTKYGKKQGIRDTQWCPRLFLHCLRLSYSGKEFAFDVSDPLPPDLAQALRQVGGAGW